jgi:hypothetical protein
MLLKNNFKGEGGERIPHDWLNTIANFWNDLKVVDGTLIKRQDGRFTTIKVSGNGTTETPDAAGLLTGTQTGYLLDPGRCTIERNPEPYYHNAELQLFDVDSIGTWRFALPYFHSKEKGFSFTIGNDGFSTLAGTSADRALGTLAWAVLDGHSDVSPSPGPISRSLEVATGVLQVGSFDLAATCSVPYAAANIAGDKWLEWRPPVTHNGTPCAGASQTVELITANSSPASAPCIQLTLTHYHATVQDGALNLVPAGSVVQQVAYAFVGPIQGTIGTVNHDDLSYAGIGTFAAQYGASCADHDARHFRRGAVGASQNYCDAIGNTVLSGAIIDLNNYKLRALYNYPTFAVQTRLDWANGTLAGESTDWWTVETRLRVTGNGTFGTALHLTGTSGGYYIDGTKVVGPRQGSVGTYPGLTGTTYTGIDGTVAGTVYAAVSDLNDLEAKVESIGTYLAALCAALGSHGLIAP